MKLSDYVVEFVASLGIKHVFLITGGACAHLVDSFHGRDDIKYVCVHHEQAGAMAAECYARTGPGLGAAMATSGPGATNLITGICCAWFDSIPTLYITGQVNTFESRNGTDVRQVGFQETDIVSMVRPVTKFAELVEDPQRIRCSLEKAVHVARTGRPGPVLLDIPMNVQRAQIDPSTLPRFMPDDERRPAIGGDQLNGCASLVEAASRPVLLFGGGIRCAGAMTQAREFADALGVPIVVSWSGFDLMPHDHPLYAGQIGVYGSRGANFAVQNSDLLISVGSRLDTRQTGGRPATFAREAKKIIVDIDPAELGKRRGLTPDIGIEADAGEFFRAFLPMVRGRRKREITGWIERTQEWKRRYPACLPEYRVETGFVNPYVFASELSDALPGGEIVIPECGANLVWMMQGFRVKERQRVISAFGNSPMGYALPASIGAAFAAPSVPVICVLGDGGLQINLQELQTVAYHQLPIKIFVLNNRGYGIIKQFQEMYFGARYEATGKGYSCPDFSAIAGAYGIPAVSIQDHSGLREGLRRTLRAPGPVLCDVNVRPDQKLVPKLEFGRPIEDLTPYLDRKEFLSNLLVTPDASSVEEKVTELG